MDGILIVNKEKNYTSRDVINILNKKFKTSKIGHTGTLDPIATGVLVVCIGKALKISELITATNKTYQATMILGIETDTLDSTGTIIHQNKPKEITKEEITNILNYFKGQITQEVPAYSAIKINGKKLYEYTRNNIPVELPKREVTIYDIKLLNISNNQKTTEITFQCTVSKGTYIRSLIRDIGRALNTYATMTELTRIKQGEFSIQNAYTLEDIQQDNYQLLPLTTSLELPKIQVAENTVNKIKNGQILPKFFKEDKALIIDNNNNPIAIYQTYEKDSTKVKPWKIL